MKKYQTADEFYNETEHWNEEVNLIRKVLLKSPLEETIKWGAPCYTYNGKNIVGIGSYKSYAGIWFFQGALLSDPYNTLINAQEGTTKALRQWRFNSINDIDGVKISEYLFEAIENHKNGKEIKATRGKKIIIPDLLKDLLEKNSDVLSKFNDFTPGKQKEFANYINDAKRTETKINRIEKIIPLILNGTGLNDKYRK